MVVDERAPPRGDLPPPVTGTPIRDRVPRRAGRCRRAGRPGRPSRAAARTLVATEIAVRGKATRTAAAASPTQNAPTTSEYGVRREDAPDEERAGQGRPRRAGPGRAREFRPAAPTAASEPLRRAAPSRIRRTAMTTGTTTAKPTSARNSSPAW